MNRLIAKMWQAAVLAWLVAAPAFAQSETQLVRGVNEVLRLVIAILGPAVLGYGLVRGFAAYSSGDEENLRAARNAVIGGLGILFTFTIVKAIIRVANVSY